MVADQQADIEGLKGKQKTHQNINFLRITSLDCQGKDVNSCFLHLSQELGIQSIKQSDFSARTLAPKVGQQPPLPGQGRRISNPFTDLITNQTNNKPVIIVEFYNFWVRRQVYAAKKGLKGTGVFLSEQLPKETNILFYKYRQLRKDNKIKAAWTHELKITVKSNQGTNIKINTEADLKQF